jgi:hypothetical protein
MIGPRREFPGRPGNVQRRAVMRKFHLTYRPTKMPLSMVEQLLNCKDDSARRLLLGVSKKVRP